MMASDRSSQTLSDSAGTQSDPATASTSEGSAATVSVNKSIDAYIKQAKKKREALVKEKSKKEKGNTSSTDIASNQIMMPIGKMYHCGRRGRGIHIRGVTPTNIIFNKDCTYQRMLEKCCSIYSTEEREKATFYVADSRGIPIWTSDYLVIDGEDGEEQKVPWTLMKYIEYSHFKYASKAKFFCVRNVDTSDSDEQMDADEVVRPEQPDGAEGTADEHVHVEVSDKNETEGTHTKFDNALFTPKFIVIKKSHYRNGEASFIITDQESALMGHMGDNMKIKDDVEQHSGFSSLNPCHYGCIFSGIDIEGSECGISVVEKMNRSDGTVVLQKPNEGSQWGLWTGAIEGDVAVMVAIVTGGYHGISSYQWAQEEQVIEKEVFPIIYVTEPGMYKCSVCIQPKIVVDLKFAVGWSTPNAWELTVEVPPPCLAGNPAQNTTENKTLDHAIQRLCQLSLVDTDEPSKLKLIKVIGQGGFGTVHLASWRGSLVAAKIISLSQKDVQACMKESDILRKLHHPHLSALLGVVQQATSLTIISPLIHGSDLHNLIFSDDKEFCMGEKFYILSHICQALVYLHTSLPPLAHLDVKPANIMVDTATLHAVLTDFGLARIMSQTTSIGTRTMMAGSPGFQPPEQLRSESIGPHCDVYAFGGVMVITITEKVLWPGLNAFQIMQKVTVENRKPSTDSMAGDIKTVCNMCFSDVKERPMITVVLKSLLRVISGSQ